MIERPASRGQLRTNLEDDIKKAARRLLIRGGADALTLAAIARELGITAPAIYRYFTDLEALTRTLAHELVTELTEHMQMHVDAVPEDDPEARIQVATREFREWTRTHRAEFALLFGTPPQATGTAHDYVARDWVCRLSTVFGEPFTALWQRDAISVPTDEELEPALLDELARYREAAHLDLSLGAVSAFLSCWNRIYGMACLEAFDYFGFTFTDHNPLFENLVRELTSYLGMRFRTPEELVAIAVPDVHSR